MTEKERTELNEGNARFYAVNSERLAMMTDAERAEHKADRLERKLIAAINGEKRAHTRVKRAATLLHKWSNTRRRIEKQIGEAEVRRIVNRLTMKGGTNE